MSADLSYWQRKLDQLVVDSSVRKKQRLDSAQGAEVVLDGRSFINFASNDYLGLANDERVIEAAVRCANLNGVGSGASHMVVGHHLEHETLEHSLAEFTGRDRALLFSTGYMANLSVAAAFNSPKSLILQDKLNHASLIDGARLSGARSQRYLHNDISSLEAYLQRARDKGAYDVVTILTDGVFSMDGDIAKLDLLAELAKEYRTILAVDDAHGLGVLGKHGGGSLELFDVAQNHCDLLIGTFGKAFGTAGAFVAGPSALIDYLEQFARPHIYTTAMPPAIAAATSASLRIISSENERRERLASNIRYFRTRVTDLHLELLESQTAIQGLVVGENAQVIAVGEFLKTNDCLVGVIRPPTVPNGSARLRITLTSEHRIDQIDRLVALLNEAKNKGLFDA